ncbi:MAG: hypothetical protein A2Z27_04430 [candidate division Zixibacteria bacterium RBG_16_50_21]|nr:MAG: hypothetical protein A2Z27_04430 [candidate division Zixibacteria bacterium RBG_16_50_21]
MKTVLSLLGIGLLCLGCAATFAPRITDTNIHHASMARDQCLTCHLEGKQGTPTAPGRMLKEDRRVCTRCHR